MTKKFDKDEALAKISVLIKKHYEKIGRQGGEDIEMGVENQELIDDIEGIIEETEISQKHLIIESLELNNEMKERLKEKW